MQEGTEGHDTLPPHPRLSPDPMPVALTNAQIRFLRGQAHDLKAILQVGGKGITDALAAEVDGALEHHELIKVKVAAADREDRDAMIAALAERTEAVLVQRIGHTAVLYRPSKDQRQIVLPRA
ncbi:ribosome assembly RNA-binding protein YhbY [Thermomonas brevis]